MRRWVGPVAVLVMVLAWPPAALAQDPPRLVISAPSEGAVGPAGPTVIVVELRGVPDGTVVRFRLTVDGQVQPGIRSVTAGTRAKVEVGDLDAGGHAVDIDPADAGLAVRGDGTTFELRATAFNPAGLIVVAGLIALLLFYRRRVLEPFSRRYDPTRPEGRPEDPEDRPGSEDRPTA